MGGGQVQCNSSPTQHLFNNITNKNKYKHIVGVSDISHRLGQPELEKATDRNCTLKFSMTWTVGTWQLPSASWNVYQHKVGNSI